MNDSVILIAGVSGAGVLFVLLICRVVARRRKNKSASTTLPDRSSPDYQSMANVTRVLPIGMLIAKSGSNRGMVYAIEPSGIKIGRDREKNQVTIPDPVVSREHAWIGLYEGKVIIKDTNSSNGTYINSLDSPRIDSHELKDGDIIYLGKTGAESFKFKAA